MGSSSALRIPVAVLDRPRVRGAVRLSGRAPARRAEGARGSRRRAAPAVVLPRLRLRHACLTSPCRGRRLPAVVPDGLGDAAHAAEAAGAVGRLAAPGGW
jgi:hypothetical protein